MTEKEFKDGKLVSDITEICNVWNTSETNARLREFINDFRAEVLKEAADRAVAFVGTDYDRRERWGDAENDQLRAAIFGEHVRDDGKTINRDVAGEVWDMLELHIQSKEKTALYDKMRSVFPSKMTDLDPVVQDAVQKNFGELVEPSGSNELLKQRGWTQKTICVESCPECGTAILPNGFGAHHSATCKMEHTNFNKPIDCPTCAESVDGALGAACFGQCRKEEER